MQTDQAHLILSKGGEQKNIYTLNGDTPATIGRAVENTVAFIDDRCSRFHAKIYYETGQWYVQDLGSRNGTYVDGEFVSTHAFALQNGQEIKIGHTALKFSCGMPDEEDTHASGLVHEDTVPLIEHHSGVFGFENSDHLQRPASDDFATEILNQRAQSEILAPASKSSALADLKSTRTGFGPVELCRLAYNLGKTEEIDKVARLAIEWLLQATGGEGAGLWLFPYSLHAHQQAANIRLVANATLEGFKYIPVSEVVVRTVFERGEALILHEVIRSGTGKTKRHTTKHQQSTEQNNTLAIPIRFQSGILGLLHIYTITDTKQLDETDLDYALAVADTIGIAISHIHKQKELAANLKQARNENVSLREMLQMSSEIIGNSKPMQIVQHLISRAAEGKTALLIRGESGSGKELIARAVHFASPRGQKPLVSVNCAALAETLLESELFGHERGAFTGATERKIGKFEASNGGTLFLDEIGEMSPNLQSKLLRVLESSSFQRVGGNQTISVDVRLITATNRDLEKEVADGRFRHDLFFRLRVLEIVVPPLRKRPDDIPLLAAHFLSKFSQETGRKYTNFDANAMSVLMSYRWPGNIRELKNVIERAVVLGNEPTITEDDLLLSNITAGGGSIVAENSPDIFIPLTLDDVERNHIIRTLEYVGWNKSNAARQLGIERTTLDRKVKKYSIEQVEPAG